MTLSVGIEPTSPRLNPGVLSRLNYEAVLRRSRGSPRQSDVVCHGSEIFVAGRFRWARDAIERRHSMPGIEPGPPRLAPRTVRPPYWWRITDQLRPIGKWKWSGSRELHPDRRVHNAKCCCYTTILIGTGALGRTRTDEYGFTKPALWLLRHKG